MPSDTRYITNAELHMVSLKVASTMSISYFLLADTQNRPGRDV